MSRTPTNKRDIFTGMNEKIADISHADTNKHELRLDDLGFPSNIVKIILGARRVTGTGKLRVYPISGTQGFGMDEMATTQLEGETVAIVNGKLTYSLTVINDDFDVFCFGYTRQLSLMQSDIR